MTIEYICKTMSFSSVFGLLNLHLQSRIIKESFVVSLVSPVLSPINQLGKKQCVFQKSVNVYNKFVKSQYVGRKIP